MNYEEAFEALKSGDFQTACRLLEKAAEETGYASELINHSYTLALYQSGGKAKLADVSFRIGSAMVEQDPGSAMDYFQRALFAGLEAGRVRRIGEIFEDWLAPSLNKTLESPVTHVAHVVGSLLPGHAPTHYVQMLVSSLRKQGIRSTVFTTESAASWFFNSTAAPQSQSVELEADLRIASVEGDFFDRAQRIAGAIRSSGVGAALFHGGLDEQITARVAVMRPAPLQINVNHGVEMDVGVFDGRIHLYQNAMERTRFGNEPAEWIPPASDIETRIQMAEPLTRQAMGLESAGTISATFGELNKVAGSGYLRVLSEILNRFPKHFHLFAGAGNVRAIRSHLHGEGVLPRVRFLGQVGDVAALLNVVDVYLAPFQHSGGHSLLEAMGAGKPVVALRFPPDSPDNAGAELVGIRELTAPGEAGYIDIADRLLRNPALRLEKSRAVHERFRTEFRPERLGERYKQFMNRLFPS